ncbi:MAG: hypothetical protein ACRCZH_05430 [Cetobacterium sp.]
MDIIKMYKAGDLLGLKVKTGTIETSYLYDVQEKKFYTMKYSPERGFAKGIEVIQANAIRKLNEVVAKAPEFLENIKKIRENRLYQMKNTSRFYQGYKSDMTYAERELKNINETLRFLGGQNG